ncbi:ABC transporter permease subunit [Robertmurraya sp. P23]|uniref:ABC transporter permease subunit n=1 Tax=Robertmurraya sp. P23 TaxID=3436931 RepID=UPI003D969FE9
MKINRQLVWTIALKDIKGITSNKQVLIGLIILPLIFAVIFPAALILLIIFVPLTSSDIEVMTNTILSGLPNGEIKDRINALPSFNHQIIYVVVNYLLGSMFLLIPVINSMMIALNSFVGEKERGTLESLLFAPITVKELFFGKVLSAFVPTMVLTIGSFVIFGIITTVITYPIFDGFIFPNANWILLVFWLSPIITLFTILIEVLVSARSKSFQEAQQIGGLVILPIVGLFVGQATGMLIISPIILLLVGLFLLMINVLLLYLISKYNNRNTLFESQV